MASILDASVNDSDVPEYDVIIVGGGLGGLVSALSLLKAKNNLKICVIEARDRLGGRLKSKTTATGKVIELGGTWVGPLQTYIIDLLKDLEVDIHPQNVDGKNIHDNGKSLSVYTGTIPSISLFSLLDTHFMISKLEGMVQQVLKMKKQ